MKSKDELMMAKDTIGTNLKILRLAKKYPDNYTKLSKSLVKQGLSLALRLHAKIIKTNPELRRIRVKQMTLFQEI